MVLLSMHLIEIKYRFAFIEVITNYSKPDARDH